ncbi:Rho GTPase-activating protein 100F [Eumeta japonica]|uniref:Rho GTPase-activating protein 100F n=1 Tax=Eumeta variegata TaxID=151549 RepID=A0A4C1Y2Q5_EUMVA|nr:Rho GTPase-activating protein 100F [Eumeta japonica]
MFDSYRTARQENGRAAPDLTASPGRAPPQPARANHAPGPPPPCVLQPDFRKVSGVSNEIFRQIEMVENDHDATTAAALENWESLSLKQVSYTNKQAEDLIVGVNMNVLDILEVFDQGLPAGLSQKYSKLRIIVCLRLVFLRHRCERSRNLKFHKFSRSRVEPQSIHVKRSWNPRNSRPGAVHRPRRANVFETRAPIQTLSQFRGSGLKIGACLTVGPRRYEVLRHALTCVGSARGLGGGTSSSN